MNMNDLENFSKLSLQGDLQDQDLFGGAMKIGIPQEWRDVSDVRQIPDHQEVFQDCTFAQKGNQISSSGVQSASVQGTGGCVIVEILEREDDVSDEQASSFFFNDLADANKNDQTDERKFEYSNVWTVGHTTDSSNISPNEEEKLDGSNLMPKISARVKACTCIGIQGVGLMRNQKKIEEGKSSKVRIELCVLRLEAVQTDLLISLSTPLFASNDGDNQLLHAGKNGHSSLFKSILKSFEVVDWSLFC